MRKVLHLALLALACATATATAADFDESSLVRQGRLVYDSAFTAAEQARLKPLVGTAMQNVAAFFGERKGGLPDFYFCKSAACAAYLGGKEWHSFTERKGARRHADGRFWFDRPSVVITTLARAPGASDESLVTALTHELTHVETYERTGKKYPSTWFDEGLATVVAGSNCAPEMRGTDKLSQLNTAQEWESHTRPGAGMSRATHCQAGMEVQAWAEKNGGVAGILAQLEKGGKVEQFKFGGPFLPPAPVSAPLPGQDHDD